MKLPPNHCHDILPQTLMQTTNLLKPAASYEKRARETKGVTVASIILQLDFLVCCLIFKMEKRVLSLKVQKKNKC